MKRIGLVGFGFIGSGVYRRIVEQTALGLEIAFVHNRGLERIAEELWAVTGHATSLARQRSSPTVASAQVTMVLTLRG